LASAIRLDLILDLVKRLSILLLLHKQKEQASFLYYKGEAIMKIRAKSTHLWLLACGLLLLSSTALALQINNSTAYDLFVDVTCGSKEATFKVIANQVGNCPSNVCMLGASCGYMILTADHGKCSGSINGGSGLQVNVNNKKIKCIPYPG
jgi:hypothetical protein